MSGPSWRDRVAHLASPWRWRRRWRVEALVLVGLALTLGGVVGVLADGDRTLTPRVVEAVLTALFGWFVLLRPSLRSLRRWDDVRAPA